MCGIFGYVYYGNKAFEDAQDIIENMGGSADSRGGDATGIAYRNDKGIAINKAPLDGWTFKYNVPKEAKAVLGHTRYATQGSHKKNYNNHPFKGYFEDSSFAFAHNGILSNDWEVRNKFKLKDSRIDTDSYVAVQLLEHFGDLSMDSIKKTCEEVEGSFVFTILDNKDNIYITKNSNPIVIAHFKESEVYVYASTLDILHYGLYGTGLSKELWGAIEYDNEVEMIHMKDGDILKICNDGTLEKGKFTPAVDKWASYKATSYGKYWSTKGSYSTGTTTYPSHSAYDEADWEYEWDYMTRTSRWVKKDANGTQTDEAVDSYYSTMMNMGVETDSPTEDDDDDEVYYKCLVMMAEDYGYTDRDINFAIDFGYTGEDIEDALLHNYFTDLLTDVDKSYGG